MPGFQCFTLNRGGKKKNRSGGIALLVNEEICKYVEVLKGLSNDVLWFKVKKPYLKENVLFGAVYIAPEGSRFCNIECFDLIEDGLAKFAADPPDSAFCLVGDFNARTAGLSDLFSPDENVCNNLGLGDDLFDTFSNVGNHSFLEQSNFKWRRDRNNMDTKVNNYGKRLVQLCKNTGSIILNGRMGVNDSSGCFTCKDASVVDYALAFHALLSLCDCFNVLNFDPLLSDVHCPIVVRMLCDKQECMTHDKIPAKAGEVRVSWNKGNKNNFLENIDVVKVNELCWVIDQALSGNCDANSGLDVNVVVEKCSKILLDAAKKSGNLTDISTHSNFRTNDSKEKFKPWFNHEYKNLRKNYHRAKHYYWRSKSAAARSNLVQESKSYKKSLNRLFRLFQNKLIDKLRKLECHDPKAYWSILNKSCSAKKKLSDITIETFFEHFKGLNVQGSEQNLHEFHEEQNLFDNDELNEKISNEDVLKALKHLKNGKACADDLILNEFLKHSQDVMLPLYTKLFNFDF